MILQIIISSLKNPLLLIKLIQWRLKPSHKNKIKPELQFFAIDKKFQGQGWGKKLIKKLAEEFKKEEIKQYRVGTKADNTLSNNFYKKSGFEFFYKDNFFGDKFNYYISPEIK